MEETLYKTKINYVDIYLSTGLPELESQEISNYINSTYKYDEFHIEKSEFTSKLILLTLYSDPIILEVKNIINNTMMFKDEHLEFRFTNISELQDGLNSISQKS